MTKYNINQINSERFYQMPKFLFQGKYKTELSTEAKVLYMLLKDRHELSVKNYWYDDNGDVYLYYPRREMMEMLGCGKDKILKLCNELKEFGLYEEVRQGLNKPNKIYLSYIDFETIENLENSPTLPPEKEEKEEEEKQASKPLFMRSSEKPTSGSLKNRSQEFGKTEINKTDNNKTNNISYNQSIKDIYNINNIYNTQDEKLTDEIDKTIKNNLEYDYVKDNRPEMFDFVESCFLIISEVCHSSEKIVRIGKIKHDKKEVQNRLLRLTPEHLEYVKDCVENNNKHKIRNFKSYLLTSLYNAPVTMDSYYRQKVNYDMQNDETPEKNTSSIDLQYILQKVNCFA